MAYRLTKEEALKRVDQVLTKADAVIADNGPGEWVSSERAQAFRSAGLTLLRDFYGKEHHHYLDFDSDVEGSTADGYMRGRALMSVVREEIDGGLLTATRALIAAGLFSDFLEMANHLLDEGYKDAAAVIAGSSLEAHLS